MRDTKDTQGGMPQCSASNNEETLTTAAISHTDGGTKQHVMKTHLININTAVMRLGMFMLLVFAAVQAKAQTIPNSSFETNTKCPQYSSDVQQNTVTGWSTPTSGTPDYFNTCNTWEAAQWPSVAPPQNGAGYLGGFAEAGGIDYKEYVTTMLTAPLVTGTIYEITYYVRSTTGTAGGVTYEDLPAAMRGFFGLMFSTTAPTTANTTDGIAGSIVSTFPAAGNGGKVLIPASNPIYTTHNVWTKVTLNYTAAGGEQYMTVGQFRPGNSTMAASHSPYFYLDNFNITPLASTSTCKTAGSTITFTPGTSNTTTDYSTVYILTDSAGVIQNTSLSPSGFTAPSVAGTYNLYSVNYRGTLTGNTVGSNISDVTSDIGCVAQTSASLCITPAPCYSDANMGAGLDTKTGISMLERIAPDNGNWPMIRKSAHTVLESNTKGFVITRMTTAQINAIVSPQEGMMVYDTDLKCLKINSDSTTTGWSCYDTAACP